MRHVYQYLISALWIAWSVYWWFSAQNVKATLRHEPAWSRAAYMLPLAIAIALLALPSLPGDMLAGRLLPRRAETFWTGTALVALGLAFSIWARALLGRNWSGTVTIKEDHELIRAGPYRLVRHPIYAGLLLAIVGSAVARGEWRGMIAFVLAGVALWRKLRLEERWLTETFGTRYDEYRKQVRALIPFVL